MGTAAGSTAPGAREEASNLAGEAGDAGRRVAGVAKEETQAVGSEARRQAKRLADRVGGEVHDQAAHQQSRAATGLRDLGDEFSKMAAGQGSGSGLAADVARQAGDRMDAAAQWLGERDPKDLLEEVKGFARRRPGVFIAIAVGAGVVVGRLVRALAQPADDGAGRSRATGATGADGARRTSGTTGAGTGTTYGTTDAALVGDTAAAPGVPGVTGSETVVSGTAGDTTVDPLTGESWSEGSPTTSRGGIR